jgi:hypothetical protein
VLFRSVGKKGLWPGLVGILKMVAAKRLMQINSGFAFCWAVLGSSKNSAKRAFVHEIDPAQIRGATH